jgi:hypothetical protein
LTTTNVRPFRRRCRHAEELGEGPHVAATDGCLINTGRHVAFVSTDRDLMETFLSCIGRNPSKSGIRKDGNAYRVQFGDVELYGWLSETGLTQRKSLTLGSVEVPPDLFLDLVRGLFDCDGSISHYVHRPALRKYPGYLYRRLTVRFHSASPKNLRWLQKGWPTSSRSRAPLSSSRRTANTTCTRCSTRSTHQSRY